MLSMKQYGIAFMMIFMLFSCKKEDDKLATLNISITLTDNDVRINQGDEITAHDGRKFSMQTFRFYMSNITLVKSNGDEVFLKDVFLYRWGGVDAITLDIPSGSYDSLVFGLGLDSIQNLSNPSEFPDSHPLSIAQDMYWAMLKYRFLLMEGAVDTSLSMTGAVNFPTAYHLGSDELYRRVARPWRQDVTEGDAPVISIPIELKDIFDGPGGTIDMRTHFSNHSTDIPKANIMMDNMAAALE